MDARYFTTTLPYVNADPHMGHALEFVQADVVARFNALMGHDVFFNTGTDEHGQKIFEKAREAGKEPQVYVDEYAQKFRELKGVLGLFDELHFIRTTDPHHKAAAQEFWRRCEKSGDIYKKLYKVKYCIGCELEKTDSELENGKCPIHPTYELEIREEENYFFRFSKYQNDLLALYESRPDFVVPAVRMNEIKSFVSRGLEDFSISRLKEKMSWGVPVPGDDTQVMYVWFDALVNYISTLGWPEDEANFVTYWGTKDAPNAVQFAGKDNLRQQSAMWQAMLLSAGLPTSKQIAIHGFITSGGQKMSKSIGNVVNPYDIVAEYGTDALRYYLARHVHPFEDSDLTNESIKEAYNAHLANGLGNFVSRVMKMAETNKVSWKDYIRDGEIGERYHGFPGIPDKFYETYELNKVLDEIWKKITALDLFIQREQPFKKIKTDEVQGKRDIAYLASHLLRIGSELEPFMPETSRKIKEAVRANKMPEPLFVRK